MTDKPNDEIEPSVTPKENGADSNPTATLREQLEHLRDRVKTAASALKAVQKGVTALLAKDALQGDVRAIEAHLRALRKAKLEAVPLADERDRLTASIEEHVRQRREALRRELVGSLRRMAATEGLELVPLGDSPPSVLVAPVTVTLELDAGKAQILYAREVVLETALEPRAILDGRVEAMDQIRAGAVDSDTFFDQLRRAYDMVLAATGGKTGDRVDLVDLRLPLALLRTGAERWRRLAPDKTPGYERYQLAYALRRLRRDQALEKDGLRIDLGSATGATTKDKRNVLFIPSAGADGQYYLSIRFLATG